MIALPAGIFLMGSRAVEGTPEEHPLHEVALASFLLDRTEVTAKAYLSCVRAGACTPPHDRAPLCNGGGSGAAGRDDHPINCLDFAQAEAYCRFAGKRLPSEREWEYAARGGSERRRYSWGEEPPDEERACYNHIGSCPVGSFAPGAFGLLDMSGNVWEWTSTFFGPYPVEADAGQRIVYRGGGFSRRFPKWLRTALRNRFKPGEWSAALGVRCARSIAPVQCPPDTEPRPAGSGSRGPDAASAGATASAGAPALPRPELPPACVRVRGTPGCEPGYAWNGDRCALAGPGGLTLIGRATPPPSQGAAALNAEPAPRIAPADAPVVRARTPELDADCQRHYRATPAAYRYTGGTFHGRNPVLGADGCTKRDVGEGWTSACCAR